MGETCNSLDGVQALALSAGFAFLVLGVALMLANLKPTWPAGRWRVRTPQAFMAFAVMAVLGVGLLAVNAAALVDAWRSCRG